MGKFGAGAMEAPPAKMSGKKGKGKDAMKKGGKK
jgi:hypothetical protein